MGMFRARHRVTPATRVETSLDTPGTSACATEAGEALCRGPAEAVQDAGPFRGVRRGLDGDPIEGLRVETVEGLVKGGGVRLGVRGHFLPHAQYDAVPFARNRVQIERRRGTVVARVHAGSGVRASTSESTVDSIPTRAGPPSSV